ncbi:MAG: hypothetical protein JSV95_00085 [Gemmatimonadota bacterium]|jgi:hypothetical protein|nr:MAG: hypothetical protein JSV95_00085 [Gemmatimonadota bacterium]
MATQIRRVEYFYTMVKDEPGEGFRLLSQLAEMGIGLLAFSAVPLGPLYTQLTVFPQDSGKLLSESRRAGLELDGPHPALLAQGDDVLGALAGIYERLAAAGVNVYASTGVADDRGGFGHIFYIRPEEFLQAARALGL